MQCRTLVAGKHWTPLSLSQHMDASVRATAPLVQIPSCICTALHGSRCFPKPCVHSARQPDAHAELGCIPWQDSKAMAWHGVAHRGALHHYHQRGSVRGHVRELPQCACLRLFALLHPTAFADMLPSCSEVVLVSTEPATTRRVVVVVVAVWHGACTAEAAALCTLFPPRTPRSSVVLSHLPPPARAVLPPSLVKQACKPLYHQS